MFNKFKSAIYSVVSGPEALPGVKDANSFVPENRITTPKFPYSRPQFLQFNTEEEIQVSADHHIRPIIVPRDISKLPWNSGYAEAVNAGKSKWNEDQACMNKGCLIRPEANFQDHDEAIRRSEVKNSSTCLPYYYFALFDGHAGVGAAVSAANQLHFIIHEKLVDILDHLLPPLDGIASHHIENSSKRSLVLWFPDKTPSKESLIIGALELAFHEMDNLISEDRQKYSMRGGCTALVALFILGKLYVANAGDSRAVLCRNRHPHALSHDFTPETERQRIRQLAALQPELLGKEFTHRDYIRRLTQKDLGKRILYRDAFMTGWAYKTVTSDDLKFPVVHGEGKRSRVLATIGVTRGFGDHDLKSLSYAVPIKPFLLSQPEVHIFDILNEDVSDSDVLVMGTDGLWDVTGNNEAAEIVQKSLDHFPPSDMSRLKYRYTSAAQDLVMHSRGRKMMTEYWQTADGKAATIDDISVFVIPLASYKKEFLEWKEQYNAVQNLYDAIKDTNNSSIPATRNTVNNSDSLNLKQNRFTETGSTVSEDKPLNQIQAVDLDRPQPDEEYKISNESGKEAFDINASRVSKEPLQGTGTKISDDSKDMSLLNDENLYQELDSKMKIESSVYSSYDEIIGLGNWDIIDSCQSHSQHSHPTVSKTEEEVSLKISNIQSNSSDCEVADSCEPNVQP